MKFWALLAISFLIVAFGQPAWLPEAGLLAAALGYALFWKAMLQWEKRSSRFLLAFLWFALAHGVQLSWMTATDYMGPLILVVYLFLILGVGAQFGLLSAFLDRKPSALQGLALAGGFVLMEWARLYFLSGFTWNPAGLALAGSRYGIQLAALFGIYGLTFWVIWTNWAALAFFLAPSFRRAVAWSTLALFPYGFGLCHEAWVKSRFKPERELTAALVNTGLFVEEKYRDRKNPHAFIPPLIQWERVWSYLERGGKADLIVLPEAAFPYGTDRPFCPLEIAKERWQLYFGNAADFPPLEPPFAFLYDWRGAPHWMATNAFFAQAVSNHFQADLIAGLDFDPQEGQRTNAAFLFRPHLPPERYDKRILAPVGEYIPLEKVKWIADFLAKEFGVWESFEAGKEAKIFASRVPIGVPICLEEIYSGLVRELRGLGAELFVSLSNDVWFPATRLAQQHFDHGRIRAVENGVFLLRSSNMGVTGGVDCFGQPIGALPPEQAGAVYLSIPVFSYPTLFSIWGDGVILLLSSLSLLIFLIREGRRKSCR